jgi:predicted alpha/beta-hydrolase family hydrolase
MTKATPKKFQIQLKEAERVTARLYRAARRDRAGITLLLGHGAGADQTSGFIVSFARGLAERGLDVVTFNFLYTEQGRRAPDPNDRLEACYRAVIAAVRRQRALGGNQLAIGGKSLGGRIASQVAATGVEDLAGLVFLGYPLHPPGKPDQLRAEHLARIRRPMLFVQGARDPFGTPGELQPILNQLPPRGTLYAIADGDHSFTVPKRSPIPQAQVYAAAQDEIARWLKQR